MMQDFFPRAPFFLRGLSGWGSPFRESEGNGEFLCASKRTILLSIGLQ